MNGPTGEGSGENYMVRIQLPKIVNDALSRHESTGIIQNLKRIQMTNRWNPVLEDYVKASCDY